MDNFLKKAWYIEGYTMDGGAYCRSCVAETLEDPDYADPYCIDENDSFKPIFASDIEGYELEDLVCEYCFGSLG